MPDQNLRDSESRNNKILVTGAAGLVGNELLQQLLKEGFYVKAGYHAAPLSVDPETRGPQQLHINDIPGKHAWGSPSLQDAAPNLEIVQCDILDVVALAEIMKDVTHVYHCAAIVSFDPAEKNRLLKINVEGTANIVNACIDAGVKKLVYVSSVAALGRMRFGEVITEKMNWTEETSNSIYGKSKYLGELEVWRGIGEGLQAVIVNPTIILGGHDWTRGSSAIFKTAYDEFKWYTEGISGFVDVQDVALAMILLMNSKITGQRFILNGENLSYKEIFVSIAGCFKKRAPYKKVTPFMAELVWRMEAIKSRISGKKHLLTKETARTAQAKVYYDNSKILKTFPHFRFTKISEAISRTCATLKERYHL